MSKIKKIRAREILDSRGYPTVEVDIDLESGASGRGAAPSGSSTGNHEAMELRDNEQRYGGKGVTKAVGNVVNIISPALSGDDWSQETLDQAMIGLDNTPNKSKLGANAILAVSLAFAHAQAREENLPLYAHLQKLGDLNNALRLPTPLMLMIEGGKHADRGADFQEFMIVPHGANSFREALRWGAEIYAAIGKILKTEGFSLNVGAEGAFGPNLASNEKIIEIILKGVEAAGYIPRQDVSLALDVASSEFFEAGKYNLKTEKRELSGPELIELYESWVKKYPIVSIEDGLAEDDWEGWQTLSACLGASTQLVGDDLFVTNLSRLKMGVEKGVANAVLIKLNQIGTVTETLEVFKLALTNHYAPIVSHRAGETEDTTIADLAVGLGAGQIKTGAPARTDRIAKYNQLLRIEEELGDKAIFAGKSAFEK